MRNNIIEILSQVVSVLILGFIFIFLLIFVNPSYLQKEEFWIGIQSGLISGVMVLFLPLSHEFSKKLILRFVKGESGLKVKSKKKIVI